MRCVATGRVLRCRGELCWWETEGCIDTAALVGEREGERGRTSMLFDSFSGDHPLFYFRFGGISEEN